MSNTFRAAPWVPYDPTASARTRYKQPVSDDEMEDDIDMDAPQISTLREEESPPPQRKTSSSRKSSKTKAAVKTKLKPAEWLPARPDHNNGESEDDMEDPEEEEDQLIDDDDDDITPSRPLPLSGRSIDAALKQKTTLGKRKSRKSEKPEKEKEKKPRKTKAAQSTMGAPNLAPTMLWFEAKPSNTYPNSGRLEQTSINKASDLTEQSISKAVGKKKEKSPRKPPIVKTKLKLNPIKIKAALSMLPDESAVMSEANTGTAPSSPVSQHYSPEPEPAFESLDIPPAPLSEGGNHLENIAVPVYPLPTKPFPVQPPVKIPSGFAPPLPLDKSGKKVRHWRTANREIRGIAGGRWFTHTWVGDKDSELSTALQAAQANKAGVDDKASANGISLPKLPSASVAASPSAKGTGKGKKGASSLSASAAPSRSASMGPEGPGIPITSKVHVPTKMRVHHVAESPGPEAANEGEDVDMVPPPESES